MAEVSEVKIQKVKDLLVRHVYPKVTLQQKLNGADIRNANDLAKYIIHTTTDSCSCRTFGIQRVIETILKERCIAKQFPDPDAIPFEELALEISKCC